MKTVIDVNEIVYLYKLISENGGIEIKFDKKDFNNFITKLMITSMFMFVNKGNDTYSIKIKDNKITIENDAHKEKTK